MSACRYASVNHQCETVWRESGARVDAGMQFFWPREVPAHRPPEKFAGLETVRWPLRLSTTEPSHHQITFITHPKRCHNGQVKTRDVAVRLGPSSLLRATSV